jgi:hypothetical protein
VAFLLHAIVALLGRLWLILAQTSLFCFVSIFIVFDIFIAIFVARFEAAHLVIAFVATFVTYSVVGMSVIALITVFVRIAFRTTLIANSISVIGGVLSPAVWTGLIDFAHLAALVTIPIAPMFLTAFIAFLD